ncbi:MAG: TRAP transporter large permease, partial [Sutterellaceae bacterium]|nr:TRAP transporter large permease [Burkholderiaceae bacterium]MDW8429702.1 TRAP transporter large permease [Sutterellaceae bacterium]
QFATAGGLSRALFRCAAAFIGHLRGGLAMASVLACAAFGAVCGSSVATAATVSQVAMPEMQRFRYDGGLATATLAAGGTLGILIPPSVVLIVYAIITEQNIAKLFAAAMIPGLLAALGYLLAIALAMRFFPHWGPVQPRLPWGERLRTLTAVWPVVAIFLIVFGGIYGGVFTPTEGAAVGCLCTFVAGVVNGGLRGAELRRCILSTAETTAMIFMIFVGADLLNAALALTQMPAHFADLVAQLAVPPLAVVAGILLLYVLLGAVMDELSMVLLTLPVIFPAVMQLDLHGLDATGKAIWFGILVLSVVEIGLIAPPVGLNVYVVNGIAKTVPMGVTYRRVFIFLCADAVRIALLFMLPVVSLWLVQFAR